MKQSCGTEAALKFNINPFSPPNCVRQALGELVMQRLTIVYGLRKNFCFPPTPLTCLGLCNSFRSDVEAFFPHFVAQIAFSLVDSNSGALNHLRVERLKKAARLKTKAFCVDLFRFSLERSLWSKLIDVPRMPQIIKDSEHHVASQSKPKCVCRLMWVFLGNANPLTS